MSYSTKDAAFAEKLYDYLTGQGLSCWMAPRSIAPGSEYGEAIIEGIEQAEAFVLIYSEHSNRSQHVLREVERCVDKKTPLIVYKIEEAQPTQSMEYFLMTNQWLQAADEPEKHMEELCRAVQDILRRARSGAGAAGNAGDAQKEEKPEEAAKAARTKELQEAAGMQEAKKTQKASRKRSKLLCAAAGLCVLAVLAAAAVAGAAKGGKEKAAGAQSERTADVPAGTPSEELSQGNAAQQQEEAQRSGELSLQVGDYITFGRYYPQGQENAEDADINWIVLSVDGQEGTALLISEKLLDMKPYDVAESGVYKCLADGTAYDRTAAETYSAEELVQFCGSSDWEKSNIRAWLNSADAVVAYDGTEPVSKGTDDGVNGYQNQAGFLYDFTKEELDRLVMTQVETPANVLGEGICTTNDRVFLLSAEEAERYLDGQKLSRYAEPTGSAAAASRGTIYPLYHSYNHEAIPWYFRTPDTQSAHKVLLCGSGFEGEEEVLSEYACSAGYGIRPVIVLRVSGAELSGEGTRLSPYTLE